MRNRWVIKCENCGETEIISENDIPPGNYGELNWRCRKCGEYRVEVSAAETLIMESGQRSLNNVHT